MLSSSPAEPPQPIPQDQPQTPDLTSTLTNAFATRRSLRQLGLFCAGATFMTVTQLVTRRARVRRYIACKPKFYQPNTQTYAQANGAIEAFEALNLATLNVVSVAMMYTGGAMWAMDVSSVEDLRAKVRNRVGTGDTQQSDEEIEEWIASILARKEMKEAVKTATGMDVATLLEKAKAAEGEEHNDAKR
ncbi:hypothetical protein IWX90DRAFT_446324 [Phyllosticta citrichinensis]|uniref:Altered inheritance of mitochondria protein 11 n=1 Tax=Phyllosticta citrichinensis TaxID=1130410 RepID=A0ABR1XFF7_9PEZI